MNSKKIIGGILVSAITMSAALSGCGLTSTNSQANLTQSVADVNITLAENFAEKIDEKYSAYKSAITDTSIIKRDLIAYFLNYGYSYIQQGYDYATVFNMLIEALTDNELITQYSTLYLLDAVATKQNKSAETVLSEYNAVTADNAKGLTVTAAKYAYLLDNTTEDDGVDRVELARYNLYSSINSSIDSYEKELLEEEETTSGTATRTIPTGVDSESEDYYPTNSEGELDYKIYTGYNGYLITDSGAYADDELEGSTRATRLNAYNNFIKSLKSNYLVSEDEDLTKIDELSYMRNELETQLKQQVIEQYYYLYEESLADEIDDTYLENRYSELYRQQSVSYNDATAFESAMSSMSNEKFILYAPDTTNTGSGTFGYVYNILLPFSQTQSVELSEYSNLLSNGTITQGDYYALRDALLNNIETVDQRSAWFNGTTDYSFKASESELSYFGKDDGRDYLFFENNVVHSDRYEKLEKYEGKYSYNGTVVEGKDGSYILVPEKLDIDDMLNEFVAYVNYVLGGTNASYTKSTDYMDGVESLKKDDEADYEKFIYASGKINLTDTDIANVVKVDSDQYKAMSAVNELQYAYTTDMGILSNYIGYSVSAYDTQYIKEFEAAAKKAVAEGVGAFNVCAGDYGWHLIYVTATFSNVGGDVYSNRNWATNKTVEGTFEYNFYEYIKSTDLSDASTSRRLMIISDFSDDTSVVLNEDAYDELLELDS